MDSTVTIGPYTLGEKPSPLVYQFLDSAGSPINLTGYSAEFHFQRSDSSSSSTGAAVVSDAANGKVTHTWTGTELSTAGTWWCEFWVGNGTNRYASVRMTATVRLQIGAVPSI